MSELRFGIDWGMPAGEATALVCGRVVDGALRVESVRSGRGSGKSRMIGMYLRALAGITRPLCRSEWYEEALDARATARWPAFLQRFAARQRRRLAKAWRKMAVAYEKGVGRERRGR